MSRRLRAGICAMYSNMFTTIICLLTVINTIQTARYNLGVILLGPTATAISELDCLDMLDCAVQNTSDLGVKLKIIESGNLTPRKVLETLCSFETEISTIVLVLPDNTNSYEHLPIYKFTVNHISSLGIPLVVWNSYMPKVSQYCV